MPFKKSKVPQKIEVNFSVAVEDERTGELIHEKVTHVFRPPTIKEREAYRDVVHSFAGGKHKLRLTKGNLMIWDACILEVRGYEDLPADGNWKAYFDDEIGRAHSEAAARILLDRLAETEEDLGNS